MLCLYNTEFFFLQNKPVLKNDEIKKSVVFSMVKPNTTFGFF